MRNVFFNQQIMCKLIGKTLQHIHWRRYISYQYFGEMICLCNIPIYLFIIYTGIDMIFNLNKQMCMPSVVQVPHFILMVMTMMEIPVARGQYQQPCRPLMSHTCSMEEEFPVKKYLVEYSTLQSPQNLFNHQFDVRISCHVSWENDWNPKKLFPIP